MKEIIKLEGFDYISCGFLLKPVDSIKEEAILKEIYEKVSYFFGSFEKTFEVFLIHFNESSFIFKVKRKESKKLIVSLLLIDEIGGINCSFLIKKIKKHPF